MDDASGAAAAKHTLRLRLLEMRRRIPPDTRTEASRRASHNLLTVPELATATTVLLYAATPTETDPAPATRELAARGVRVLLPRVAGTGLEAVACTDPEALRTGALGVLEPEGAAVPVDGIDVVVVPGVAFDRSGTRLGRGGGHYDRLLARLPSGALRVGLCFATQLVGGLPREDHDRDVDVVVTDEEVLRTRRGRDGGTAGAGHVAS